ncbi:MAG: hypothetical protein JSS70_01370 [Bacteroidetes bacterium]|nr:hypothetical protein [Bacteroidota bacterium]
MQDCKWLEEFAYYTTIGQLVFIEVGLIALIVTILTISWQSLNEARTNPVKSLLTE